MPVSLNQGERLLGSKINTLTGGKTHIIGKIGERGAVKTIDTDFMGKVIKETPVSPNAGQVLAYFGR